MNYTIKNIYIIFYYKNNINFLRVFYFKLQNNYYYKKNHLCFNNIKIYIN